MAAATQLNFYFLEMWHPQGVEFSELAYPESNSESLSGFGMSE